MGKDIIIPVLGFNYAGKSTLIYSIISHLAHHRHRPKNFNLNGWDIKNFSEQQHQSENISNTGTELLSHACYETWSAPSNRVFSSFGVLDPQRWLMPLLQSKPKKVPRFPWEHVGHTLRHHKTWDDVKTISSSSFRCSFRAEKEKKHQDIELCLMDIPGERLADIPMMDLNYDEWSDQTMHRLETHSLKSFSKEYLRAIQQLEAQQDKTASLLSAYRNVTASIICAGIPIVSPSSALVRHVEHEKVNFIGSYIPADNINEYRERAIFGLDEQSQFLPLPKYARDDHPELKKTFEQHYQKYREQVVAPLVELMRTSNTLLLAMDITGTLITGPLGREAVEHLLDSACKTLHIGESPFYRADRWFTPEVERVALVATKADTLRPIDRKQHRLKNLLLPLTEASIHNVEIVRGTSCSLKAFDVAAIRSSEDIDDTHIRGRVSYQQKDKTSTTKMPERLSPPAIPETWREADGKSPAFPNLIPDLPKGESTPPYSHNIDQLISYLLRLDET
jgi:predicted YcjX-like family ATPase